MLGFVNTTPKARMVIEGRTAIQVVTNMVSQTSGVLKAFGDAPENSRFTYSIRSSTLQDFWLKFTVKTSYILTFALWWPT